MLYKTFILVYLFFIYHGYAAEVGESCESHNNLSEGECKLVTDCEEAVRLIKKREWRPNMFKRCGFSGDQEIVCCPKTENKFGPTEPTLNPTESSLRIADRECRKIMRSAIQPLDLHIIGGELASAGEFPHMVALGFDRSSNGSYDFDCGGSLVSNTYVLTAAHCIDTLDRIEPSIVRVGVVQWESNAWNDRSDYRIAEIKKHPDYKRREKYHDLALLRLDRPVSFSSVVNAACLYSGEQDPTIPLTITGWGQTSIATEKRSKSLLKANVTVVSRETCNESYSAFRKLPRGIAPEQLCAGDPEGLHDTCQGDSGGPLQGVTSPDGQYRLVGVTSFGRGCGSPVPGVYTRLSHYLDWIEGVVWPH